VKVCPFIKLIIVVLAILWGGVASSFAATIVWKGNGSGNDSSTGGDINRSQNWVGNTAPGTNDDAVIVFDNSTKNNTSDASLFSTNFAVQNLTISNSTARIANFGYTDSVLFTNNTTLSSNLLVEASGGASNYALRVTFSNGTFSARNATFNGATKSATAGTTTTATLTFGGTTFVTSNLTFNGNTGFSVLNITNGTATIGRNLTFNGGAGTNILRISSTTIVSNNVAILNSGGSASNLLVLTSELRIGGNFSNTTANANKAGFQLQNGTLTFIGGAAKISTVEVASVGTSGANNYLIGAFQVGNSAGAIGNVRLVDGFVNNSGGSEQLLASNLSVFAGGTLDINGLSAAFQFGTNAGSIVGITSAGKGLDVSNRLSNTGTIVLGGGSIIGPGVIVNSGTINGNGVIVPAITNTGTINVTGGTLVLSNAPAQSGRINVASSGTLNVAQAWANSGVVSLNDGRIVSGGSFTNSPTGTLMGNGTITGNVINQGTFSPGFSAGKLTVNGDLTLESTSVLVMKLESTSSFDEIVVSGQLTLGGTLTVTNTTGFVLAEGDSFKIFTFGSSAGSLAATNLPPLESSLAWDTSQLSVNGTITVIPEPSALALVALGIGGLFLLRSRRNKFAR
jgi:hypothetical protein